jgi:NADPH:quinone reductase-like Zn-dependent oxidoreductase
MTQQDSSIEKIPSTMRAIVLTGHGGMDKLEYHTDWPVPSVGKNEVLIKITACGLNNTDVNTRTGWYSKSVKEATTGEASTAVDAVQDPSWGGKAIQFPRIQGADVCGRVVAVGEQVDHALIGCRVITDNWLRDWDGDQLNLDTTGYFGYECDGGFAEYTKTDFRNIGVIRNTTLSDAELATFSCSYTTAEGMLTRAKVDEKDIVLITGSSGGVGSALIQLTKRRGATVVALASEAKHARVKELGADVVLPRSPANLREALLESLGRDTVTVVADIVGGLCFGTLIDVLAPGGRYTVSGAIAGPLVELDLRTLYLKDLTFTGSTVVPPHIFRDVVGYIERGEVLPLLAATFPLSELKDAQQAFIDKVHVGNIVVIP